MAKPEAGENIEYFDSFRVAAHTLGQRIGESDLHFSKIAYLQHSGAMIVSLIGDSLGFSPLEALAIPIIRTPIGHEKEGQEEFLIGKSMPNRQAIGGERVLLLGDVWRSGGLLRHASEQLEDRGARSVSTGVAYLREDRLINGGPLPNFFGFTIGHKITFQWEIPPVGYDKIKPVRK